MPKAAPENEGVQAGRANRFLTPSTACDTCLRRKIKCDGQRPVCQKCIASRKQCDRSAKGLKFIIDPASRNRDLESASPASLLVISADHPVEYSEGALRSCQVLPNTDATIPSFIHTLRSQTDSNLHLIRAHSNASSLLNEPYPCISPRSPQSQKPDSSQEAQKASKLAVASPRVALADPCIAILFDHYITALAPWYDLNDARRIFATLVPQNALSCPILFRAIIAFSASHMSRTENSMHDIASAFHSACVQEFLELINEVKSRSHGNELAATCLLRSFEIIDGDTGEEQSHLLGAYSFATSQPIDFINCGLLQAGAWNYLREEITVALQYRRPVRTGRIFESRLTQTGGDDMIANDISYLLAQIINYCFPLPSEQIPPGDRTLGWQTIQSDLLEWRNALPPSFEPFSTAPKAGNSFSSIWMLRPWHIAARQYFAVAEILLRVYNPLPANGYICQADLDFAEDCALTVCGIASTNDDIPGKVNAFGPLAFCGRYLTRRHHQKALETLLVDSSALIGWPVHLIIQDLKHHWSTSERAP